MLRKIILYFGIFIIILCHQNCKGYISSSSSVNLKTTKKLGCHHNGTVYADGSLVPTLEPCLSCKCTNKTLICSLRICPEMPVPPPRNCILIQKRNSCCPYLSCSKFHNLPNIMNRRIIAYLDHYEKETLDRIVNENALRRRSDDFDLDGTDEICIQNGTVYKSGSAMSSSSLCSYCYCIGGTQKCVKPKCLLSMEGCKPIFVDSACCPVRYDCTSKSSSIMKSQNHARKAGNKHYQRMAQRLQRSRGCTINKVFYSEGQKIPSPTDKPCDICFCIRGSRKCAPKKCAPSIRNCLPVVPKGQCCPSSYDCGYVKDVDRAFKSRQFDLFSLLFGSDEDNSTGGINQSDSLLQQSYNISETNSMLSTTSEKSIFDAIREGLEFIDGNHKLAENLEKIETTKNNITSSNVDEKIQINTSTEINKNLTTTTSTLPSSSLETFEENSNLFDLFIDSSNLENTNGNVNHSFSVIEKENESAEKNESNEDYLSEPSYLMETVANYKTTTDDLNHNSDNSHLKDYDDDSTLITSTSEDDFTSTIGTTDDDNDNEELSTEIVTTEFYNIDENETSTINEVSEHMNASTMEVHHKEDSQDKQSISTDITSTTEKLKIEENLENSTEEKNATTISEAGVFTKFNSTNLPVNQIQTNNITQEKKPEKDFLSAFFDGLSTIVTNVTNIHHKSNFTSDTANPIVTQSLNIKNPPKIHHMSTPGIPHEKIDYKFTNKPPHHIPAFSKIPIQSIPLYKLPDEEINLKITEKRKPLPPPIIQSNPSILETDYEFDYNVPTLPPSLPNLKIIPFLPTDAVKNDRKQTEFTYYPSITTNTKRTSSWMPPPIIVTPQNSKFTSYNHHFEQPTAGIYPAITDNNSNKRYNYDDYEYSDFDVPGEYGTGSDGVSGVDGGGVIGIDDHIKFINKFPDPIKKYDVGIMEFDRTPYKGVINVKTPNNYNFEALQINNGFSPPTKTEGGFVPKEPINDKLFYENLYTTNKLHIDLTTPASSKLNTTTIIGINMPDPFKDVIKTEPPPDLHSLIEDKEKLLANEIALNDDFEKTIISITTDSSYNSTTIECKDDSNNTSFNCTEIVSESLIPSSTSKHAVERNTSVSNIELMSSVEKSTVKVPTTTTTVQNVSDGNLNYDFNSALDSIFGLFSDDEENQQTNITTKKPLASVPQQSSVSESTSESMPTTKIQFKNDNIQHTTSKSIEDLSILKDALLSSFDTSPYNNPKKHKEHKKETTTTTTTAASVTIEHLTHSSKDNIFLSEPFNKLPFMRPSYPVKQNNVNAAHNFDLIFPSFEKNSYNDNGSRGVINHPHPHHHHQHHLTHQVLPDDSIISNTESYVVNPVDIDKLKEHTIVRAEIFTKPENSNIIKDPAGILKLAGCNIYGRMYRVGRIISELSGPCLECKCTEVGVNCTPLNC